MNRKDYIFIAIGVAIIIMLALPYIGKEPKSSIPEVDLIEQMKEMNKAHTQELIDIIDRRLEERARQDSILIHQVKSTNERIRQIPNRVNNLDRDELYREISRF